MEIGQTTPIAGARALNQPAQRTALRLASTRPRAEARRDGPGALERLGARLDQTLDGVGPGEATVTALAAALAIALAADIPALATVCAAFAAAALLSGVAIARLADRAAGPMRAALDAARIAWSRALRSPWRFARLIVHLVAAAPAAVGLAVPLLLLAPIVNRLIPPPARLISAARTVYAPSIIVFAAALFGCALLAAFDMERRFALIGEGLLVAWHAAPFLALLGVILYRPVASRLAVGPKVPIWASAVAAAALSLGAIVLFNMDVERRLLGAELAAFDAGLVSRATALIESPGLFERAGEAAHAVVMSGLRLHEVDAAVWTGLHLWSLLALFAIAAAALALTRSLGARGDFGRLETAQALIQAGCDDDAEAALARVTPRTPQRHAAAATLRLRAGDVDGYWREVRSFAMTLSPSAYEVNPAASLAHIADMIEAAAPRDRAAAGDQAYRQGYVARIDAPALCLLAAADGPLTPERHEAATPMEAYRAALTAGMKIEGARAAGLIDSPIFGGALRAIQGEAIELVLWANQQTETTPPHQIGAAALGLLYASAGPEPGEEDARAAATIEACENRLKALIAASENASDPISAAFAHKAMTLIAGAAPAVSGAYGDAWTAAARRYERVAAPVSGEWSDRPGW